MATKLIEYPSDLDVGQIWLNKRSGKSWMIVGFKTPPRHEWPIIGDTLVILGDPETTNESCRPTSTIRHLRDAYVYMPAGPKHASGNPALDEANLVHDVADLIYHRLPSASFLTEGSKAMWDWSQEVAKKVIAEVRSSD